MFSNTIRRGIYQHYKGRLYAAELGVKMEGNGRSYVVYKSLDTNQFWVRPKDEFEETIEIEIENKVFPFTPTKVDVPRFKWVRPLGKTVIDNTDSLF